MSIYSTRASKFIRNSLDGTDNEKIAKRLYDEIEDLIGK